MEGWRYDMAQSNEVEDKSPEVTWGGRLDSLPETQGFWRGKITASKNVLKDRLGVSTIEEVSTVIEGMKEKISEFYVGAHHLAQVRCIDGRGEGKPQPNSEKLGPQIPGGTPVMALCYRLATWDITPNSTIEADLEDYKDKLFLAELPYIPGAHEDEHNQNHEENTGCGAIDKMLEIMSVMGKREAVYTYTKAISQAVDEEIKDEDFERVFNDVQSKIQELSSPETQSHYFMKDKQGNPRFRSKLVNKIRSVGASRGQKTVENLRGEHNEVFLMINAVGDETFDRDSFSGLTQGDIQAFNYDAWHVAARSKALLAEDPEAAKTMIISNVMYAVATAMVLTDGSLEYAIRK